MVAPLGDMSPLEHARIYRDAGLQCVPAHLPPFGNQPEPRKWKRPKLDHWSKYQDELVDEDQFADWFDEGGSTWAGLPGEQWQSPQMGFLTGRCSGNVGVVDLDTHKTPAAAEWWAELELRGIVPPIYPAQVTGGGGLQILLRWPDGSQPTTFKTLIGVDVRGQGGFAMLPPSMHASGQAYRWKEGRSPADVSIPTIGFELVAEIEALPRNSGGNDDNIVARQSTPSPANQISPIGGQLLDGREDYMKRMIWGSLVGLRREAPIFSQVFSDAECARAFKTYVAGVKTRSPDDGTPVEARLELEGRGWSEFKRKWDYAMSKWDTKIAEAAREPKPGAIENRLDGEVTSPVFSDDALALKFAEQHGDKMRYVAAWKRWLMWNDGRWCFDEKLLHYSMARNVCREAAAAANKSARSIAGNHTVNAVVSLAKADQERIAASVDQWDREIWLLNTPGGTIDLRTGEGRDHAREDYITQIAATSPGGDCPTWLWFLNEVTAGNADLQAFIGRVCGYALTGSTREHALFFLYGTGANGKSVFLNTITGILGEYAKTASIETFTASQQESHPTELARLRGARLVTVSETEEGRRWAESRIKSLTGGDKIAARFMRQDFFEFEPQFKLIIAGNHKPGLRSVDEAIRRRFHLIPFTVTVPPEKRDATLTEKLRAEWPGILRWMIAGCADWQERGLAPPEVVKSATAAYLENEDAIVAWIADRCDRQENASERSSTLYSSFRDWSEKAGEPTTSQKKFSQRLEDRGFVRQKTNAAAIFRGLALHTKAVDLGSSPSDFG